MTNLLGHFVQIRTSRGNRTICRGLSADDPCASRGWRAREVRTWIAIRIWVYGALLFNGVHPPGLGRFLRTTGKKEGCIARKCGTERSFALVQPSWRTAAQGKGSSVARQYSVPAHLLRFAGCAVARARRTVRRSRPLPDA